MPTLYRNKEVRVRADKTTVKIYFGTDLIKVHPLARLLVLALPVAFVTLVGCSSSSGSGSGANGSCAIPDGQYMMTSNGSLFQPERILEHESL